MDSSENINTSEQAGGNTAQDQDAALEALQEQADKARASYQWPEAERLYTEALERPDLPATIKIQLLENRAQSYHFLGNLQAAEQDLETIWRTSGSLRLMRAARARDRMECRVCPVVDACGGECWVQAHYAARAHDEPAGYRAAFPYCDLVRPVLLELQAEADRAAGQTPPATTVDCTAAGACGSQAGAGADNYSLFDCI